MEEIDNEATIPDNNIDDEDLFLKEVIGDDHQLLYLDTYLRELFHQPAKGV